MLRDDLLLLAETTWFEKETDVPEQLQYKMKSDKWNNRPLGVG